ncbi:MAG: helix-turn-helix transcriptional regulator [Spirochaetia bacterium]|nr:helix-turn-helix transcriptional regulator [Spirochaetia bacterium]
MEKEIEYWDALNEIILESVQLRDNKNLSQGDLAKKMETKQSVISRFENMGRVPNYDFISRLSLALEQKLGMTLCGDYMAVVPIEKQEIVNKMAKLEDTSPKEFLQALLEYAIEMKEKKFNLLTKFPNAADVVGFENYDTTSKNYFLSASDSDENDNLRSIA